MEHCKLQIGCMLVVLYVAFIYIHEKNMYKVKKREVMFEWLLSVGALSIFFDGITAYTVNNQDKIPIFINNILHMCFLCSLDIIVFMMFLYIIDIAIGMPKAFKNRFLITLPLLINILVVILFIPRIEYIQGNITNYSMGISAYTCFVMLAVYMLLTIVILFMNCRKLGRHKIVTISTNMVVSISVAIYQMLNPQALITCIVPTFVIIGTYFNIENPLFQKLKNHNNEMVMGFATLVENRDDSTGGHIKRTTAYVKILAEELRVRVFFRKMLTREYIDNLVMAAPMHDVGKIAIPDAILQKPGKLTADEYEIMKTHAERGGSIIKETFGHTGNDEYECMAYEVARYHHEKWNGKGYPDKLKRKEIPLCARIMSVVDVFDAVSAKRCYRDALPLEECFKILEDGSGQDFDPIIVEVFLDMKDKIKEIYESDTQAVE